MIDPEIAQYLTLLQSLGGQGQGPSTTSSSVPPSMDFGGNWPELQQQPMPQPLPPEDHIVSQDPNHPLPADTRMEGYRRLLTNFTFSLGSGLEAASAGGRGKGLRTTAGIGRILQMPENIRMAQEAAQEKKTAQSRTAFQLAINALKEQTDAKRAAANEDWQKQQDINADMLRQQTGKYQDELVKIKQDQLDRQIADDARKLREQGRRRDANGNIEDIPEDQLSAEEKAKLADIRQTTASRKITDELHQAQTGLAEASKKLKNAQLDPTSPIYKNLEAQRQMAERRLNLAEESLGLRREGLEIRQGKQVNEYFKPAVTADDRLAIMKEAAGPDYQGTGGQSDLALLFNHIGMTLSAQKGARITNAEIERAIETRDVPSALLQQWDRLKTGQFLTPGQRKEMVDNAITSRERFWFTARRSARLAGVTDEPAQDSSLPPLTMKEDTNPVQGAPIPGRTPAAPRPGGGATPPPATKPPTMTVGDKVYKLGADGNYH